MFGLTPAPASQVLAIVDAVKAGKTYVVLTKGIANAITCLLCGLTSWNPNDAQWKYCGHCRVFHEPTMAPEPSVKVQ